MTAEVAVLNKSAVALAADSAMTVAGTGKTYPTNKLFALYRSGFSGQVDGLNIRPPFG